MSPLHVQAGHILEYYHRATQTAPAIHYIATYRGQLRVRLKICTLSLEATTHQGHLFWGRCQLQVILWPRPKFDQNKLPYATVLVALNCS